LGPRALESDAERGATTPNLSLHPPPAPRRPSIPFLRAQWLENSAEVGVDAPLDACYAMWEDRARIPAWMPWITSVEVGREGGDGRERERETESDSWWRRGEGATLGTHPRPSLPPSQVQPDDDRLSRWLLSTDAFGRSWSFSWLAQNLAPTPGQKIHWRSVPGSTGGALGATIDIANRGAIRFYKKGGGKEGCSVKLTISYECPDALAPFAAAVTPFVESILAADLKRFKDVAAAAAGAGSG